MLESDEMFAQTKRATVSMPRDRYDQPESDFFPRRDHLRPSRTDRIVQPAFSDVAGVHVEDTHIRLKTATSETKNNLLNNFLAMKCFGKEPHDTKNLNVVLILRIHHCGMRRGKLLKAPIAALKVCAHAHHMHKHAQICA